VTPYSDPVLPGADTMWFKKQDSLTIDDEGEELTIELCPNDHEGEFVKKNNPDCCQELKVQLTTKACQDPIITFTEFDVKGGEELDNHVNFGTKADYNWSSSGGKALKFDNWETSPTKCYYFMTWNLSDDKKVVDGSGVTPPTAGLAAMDKKDVGA